MSGYAAAVAETSFRILLVEDNRGDVELVRHAVADLDIDLDIDLDVASDGEQALAFLRRSGEYTSAVRPDLVLLDLKMPRVDGLEVLAELHRDADLRSIPVVVLTSSQAPRDLVRAYQFHVRACVAKPATGLRALIADVVGFIRRSLPAPVPPRSHNEDAYLTPMRRPLANEISRARQLAAIVESAADAMIGTSLDGTIRSWNTAAEVLYGHRAAEAIGRHVRLIVPEERNEELRLTFERIRHGSPREQMRTVRVTRDRRELHLALTISPIHDSQGNIVGLSAIARDITEQVQAEERFRLAVEASPSAMLMVDAQGCIVMINKEAERLFGYRREELIGGPVDRLVPERFRQQHPKHRLAFLSAPESRAMGAGRELYGLRSDGVEVPVEIGLNPISTADGTLVLSSIVDISERRQAEQKFRLAVEAAPSGIVMVNSRGIIVLVNAETERMFGYARGELIDCSVDILVPARFRGQHAHHRQSFGQAPSARTMGTGRDLYGLRKDDTEFPVEVGLNPIETNGERLVLSTIVDITARKQSEEVLSQQAAELARSNEELEQFAYVASHDLQEPLRMVSGYTELLSERYCEALDDRARRYIAYAQDGAARMHALIDDLLAYSRVRSRGGELVPTRASTALQYGLRNLSVSLRETNAVVKADADALVQADESQLSQVFQNLLSNSLKFRGEAVPEIDVSARREGDRYVFAVRDNGIGIEPGYAEKIFQMFERLHTRDEYPGTGIGLALCRRIIERHGGKIWVESDGVHGATFLFTLPAAEEV